MEAAEKTTLDEHREAHLRLAEEWLKLGSEVLEILALGYANSRQSPDALLGRTLRTLGWFSTGCRAIRSNSSASFSKVSRVIGSSLRLVGRDAQFLSLLTRLGRFTHDLTTV